VREARRLCPDVIAVQANHRLYTEYHQRILAAVDTCKVGSDLQKPGGLVVITHDDLPGIFLWKA
jgi:hypothetical protein